MVVRLINILDVPAGCISESIPKAWATQLQMYSIQLPQIQNGALTSLAKEPFAQYPVTHEQILRNL